MLNFKVEGNKTSVIVDDKVVAVIETDNPPTVHVQDEKLVVVTETKQMESGQTAKDFYFLEDEDGDDNGDDTPVNFFIVEKSFWDKNKYVDDSLDHDIVDILPKNFHESMEACYEYGAPYDKKTFKYLEDFETRRKNARELLLKAGFTEAFWE
jgi:hypothetical protein